MPYNTLEKVGSLGTVLDTAMDNLASAAAVDTAEQDNSSGSYTLATIELLVTLSGTVSGPITLCAPVALDGTNYVTYTTGAAAVMAPGSRIAAFSPRNVSTAQRMVLRDVPVPTCGKFKLQLVNQTGAAFTTGNVLRVQYKRQAVKL